MKLFGIQLRKEKPVAFPEFRDRVRLAIRRAEPRARLETNETGMNLTMEGKAPQACNLRNLYLEYSRAPKSFEQLVQGWIDTLLTEAPEQNWVEAQATLRPALKDANDIEEARRAMQKAPIPEDLPHEPFVGQLAIILVRDLPGTAVPVTQNQLDAWGVTFQEAMQTAMSNMNMQSFPGVTQSLTVGGSKREDQEEVGLVMEGDPLTATWLTIERFRDYLVRRLQGDCIVMVRTRDRLIAIRADEPDLIAQTQRKYRNGPMQAHPLTELVYHVREADEAVTVHHTSDKADEFAYRHRSITGNQLMTHR